MGRDAMGVRGIRLRQDDYVVGAVRCEEGGALLTVTENGYGKRTALGEYLRGDGGEPQHRGGMGLKNYQITQKTGKVAGVKVVHGDEDVLMITNDGVIIRMAAESVNLYGRAAQGVILMRLADGVQVISLALTEHEEPEEEPAESTEEPSSENREG